MSVRAIVVAALALAAPAAVSGGSASAVANVRAVVLQQARLFKQAKWRALYVTFTPRYRRNCPYSTFVARQRADRRVLGANFELRGIRVRVETARRAIVAYRFVGNGRTLGRVSLRNRDVYTRIGSRWYDELDRVSNC